ncbi:hypothetical protein [Candidatus Frankia alpina]|uniref:hypothetical protein n=1 Tax=Candidatus Frankia alpina TaxID=2699483 RepID=UPI001F34BC3B|nr:hypothetical protein [Candidatus Frankia alpina]
MITRARVAARHTLTFRRAVPPVVADLAQTEGLLFAAGIGEAPIGLKGTFSLWQDAVALRPVRLRPAGAQRGRPPHPRGRLVQRGAVRAVRGPRLPRHPRRT